MVFQVTGGTVSSGEVKILKDVDTNVEGLYIIFG